jgi:hypothetical protein
VSLFSLSPSLPSPLVTGTPINTWAMAESYLVIGGEGFLGGVSLCSQLDVVPN